MLRRFLPVFAFIFSLTCLAAAQTPLRLVNVTPCRLVDTRTSSGGTGPIQGGTAQSFNLPQLAEAGGSQAACTPFSLASAVAYSLNVTLVPNGSPVGYLTIWPTGESQPLVSLMNSLDGRTKANAAIVPAGNNGAVSVFVSNTTNVVIDINAYFDSASDETALAFFPLTPCRVVDTRNNQDGGTLEGGVERDFSIPGAPCNIPSNAQAYSFNFTAVPTQGALGFLSVWPAGQSQPVVSTLNDLTGTVVANAAIVPAGSENKTAVLASNPSDVVIDVNGYFAPANSASNPLSLYTLTPCRILDTRQTTGLFTGTLPVAVVGSQCGMPTSAQAFVLNATVVPQVALGYLTLWPQGLTQPTVSTLNALDGSVTSNMAIVPSGGAGAIDSFASNNTQLILDISSYFAPISALSIPQSTLPDAVVNQNYSVPLVATGGVPPYMWTNPGGGLPDGITLTSGGTLRGTPTATGQYQFMVQAADSDTPQGTVTTTLSMTVVSSIESLTMSTTSLPDGTVNAPYNALLSANGGITPYTFSIVLGSLPPGLILNAGTGQITGIPQAPGLSTMTVQVTDAQQHTAMTPLSIAVNTGSSNGTLNGMYAFSFSGYDAGNWFVVVGSFTADGTGNITGGEYDANGEGPGYRHGTITGGSYAIAANGLGSLTLELTSIGSAQLAIATGASEDMRIIAYNQNGSQGVWGAGAVRQQNPTDFSLAALAGNWTFGFQGFNSSIQPEAGVGNYGQDSDGTISSGAEDINSAGTVQQFTFTGTAGAVDANGRYTETVHRNDGSNPQLPGYVISANELVSLDNGSSLYVNHSLRQSGTMNNGILGGNVVAQESRQVNDNGNLVNEADVGLLAFDGMGGFNITQDRNRGGTVTTGQTQTGTYMVSSNGRTTTGGNGGGVTCYVVQQNEAFCVEASSSNPGLIYFEPQAAGPFNNASLSGEYLGGSLPQYVSTNYDTINSNQFDGIGNNLNSSIYSGPGGTGTGTNSRTYTVGSSGALTVTAAGGPIWYGYVVSPGKFVVITTDPNPRTIILVKSSAP